MYCKQCGACLPDGTAACPACGCLLAPAPAPEAPAAGPKDNAAPAPEAPAAPAAEAPAFGPAPGSAPPPRYQAPAYARPAAGGPGGPAGPVNGTPAPQPGSYPPPPAAPLSPTVGVWEWLWSSIVASIPIVGFIVLLVWAFKSSTKPSKRNWARSYLIFFLIVAVVYILLIGAAIVIHAMFAGPSFSPLVDPRYNAYY